jgi:hypothetical protein
MDKGEQQLDNALIHHTTHAVAPSTASALDNAPIHRTTHAVAPSTTSQALHERSAPQLEALSPVTLDLTKAHSVPSPHA